MRIARDTDWPAPRRRLKPGLRPHQAFTLCPHQPGPGPALALSRHTPGWGRRRGLGGAALGGGQPVERRGLLMHVYLYVREDETLLRLGTSREAIGEVVVQVTPARAAKALVIAVALVPGTSWSGQYERWQTPERWLRLRGRWPRPADLPASFQLVRMALGEDTTYPYTAPDAYGWTWHYTAFRDHLATVLAHEIYH